VRERRFAMKVNQTLIFFKEFGSTRKLNRLTGEWDEATTAENVASSVIHFSLDKDGTSPYGQPRWINQLPSVLGSRKAEEFNLDFFDAGGLPPAVIFIEGGALAPDVLTQLKAYFSGSAKGKHRAAIVEVQSTSGSLDSAGKVSVKTERFGDARATDSMFMKYDENTENHVRGAFRLPPIFLGKNSDANFATAMTSVMVAEEQVFQPERHAFDEVVNKRLVKSLGGKEFKFQSNKVLLKNVDVQLAGIPLIADKVDPSDLVKAVNDITGLNVPFDPETFASAQQAAADQAVNQAAALAAATGKPAPGAPGKPDGKLNPSSSDVQKEDRMTAFDVVSLVDDWCVAMGLTSGHLSVSQKSRALVAVEGLDDDERTLFERVLASKSFSSASRDPDGLSEIAGACGHVMKAEVVQPIAQPAPPPALDREAMMEVTERFAQTMHATAEAQRTTMAYVVDKLAEAREPQKVDLNLRLELPKRKPVTKKATLPDGRVIKLTTEEEA
jgi:hypothetical protein